MFQGECGTEKRGEQMKTFEFLLIAMASGITFPVVAWFILKWWDESIWKE